MLGTATLAASLQIVPAYAQSVDSRPGGTNQAASSAVAPEQLGAWLSYIAGELRALRTEILQLRLDTQEVRISRLELEIQKVRQRQAELQAEEEQHRQQIAEANQLATQPLDPEQRNQVEVIRTELAAGGADRFRNERAEAARTEADLTQRLDHEKTQYSQIQALLTQLLPGATRQ